MGVPSFYRWLVSKYPKIVVNAREEKGGEDRVIDTTQPNPNGIEFNNLYLDMNGIIHPCFHPDNHLFPPTSFNEVFESIFEYIDRLFGIVRPRKLLYMAIDGVAPRAKMNQQRSRRFQTAKQAELAEAEEEKLRREFEFQGKVILPKMQSEVSDSNVITPGTEFLDKLSKALKCYIRSRLNNDPGWKDIKVILSDANVPGEGEHKMMSFIRLQRNRDGYNPNTRHCLYGLDADLIMLALATHEVHLSILREHVATLEQQPSCTLSLETSLSKQNVYSVKSRGWFGKVHQANGGASLAKMPFQFLNIWTLREYLELDMTIAEPPKDFLIDFERILRDKHAAYIKLKRVERLILAVGSCEDKIFKKRSEIRKRNLERVVREMFEAMGEEDVDNGEVNSKYLPNAPSLESNGLSTIRCSETDVLNNTKEFKQKLKEMLRQKSDLFKNGNPDKVNLCSEGWKARYYKAKFSVEKPDEIESKRKEIVQKYVEGLCWVLRYYFEGVCSWSWYYDNHYGPFASDFKGLGRSRINFQLGTPFKPFTQLMAVLPPRSADALPEAYRTLMTCPDSNIIDFYPTVDTDGKRYMWLGVTLLKFIDEKRLLLEIEKLENKLKDEEVRRNAMGLEIIFVRASHDLGSQVSSLCRRCVLASGNEQIINKVKIDTKKSGGLNGFLIRCNEQSCMDDSSSPVKGMEYTINNDVLCAMFENPPFDYHIPEPPKNVTMPEKTITEADIEERPLWHECNGSQRQNRMQNRPAMETRNVGKLSSSDPSSVREMCKGAGSGWGGGRGRGSLNNSNFSQNSETFRGIQAQNGSYWQPRNGMSAHRIGSRQYNTRPDIGMNGQGQGRGIRSFEKPRFGQTLVAVSGIQVRNGGFSVSGNSLRADRGDCWRSNSQDPSAPGNGSRANRSDCWRPISQVWAEQSSRAEEEAVLSHLPQADDSS